MRYLLDALYLFCLLLATPWLVWKGLRAGKYRRGLWARIAGSSVAKHSPHQKSVWFHGVSVGEIHLLRTVIGAFRTAHPDVACTVSAGTDTGLDEARRLFPDLCVIRWPFDFSWAVDRMMREVRPDLIVLAEGELWPNLLLAARRRQIPVVVINARLSPRSAGRYRLIRSLAARWLRLVTHFAVQTPEYAWNFRYLGVPASALSVTGSVKYDGAQSDRGNDRTEKLRALFNLAPTDLVWVAGSTQAPEELVALDIWRRLLPVVPNARLIVVPRQKDRFDEVAAQLQERGVAVARRSTMTEAIVDRQAVILVDTIGELNAVWGLADVAFVGGSLDGRRGGQNMIEPAAYGAAVVFGPHVWNFREPVARLLGAQAAIQVQNADQLEDAVRDLLQDSNLRQQLGAAAREMVLSQQGATDRTISLLGQILARSGARLNLGQGSAAAAPISRSTS